jgi:hypothetical protein
MRDVVFVNLIIDKYQFLDIHMAIRKQPTWIMVVNDSLGFSSLVSPQIPMILESSAQLAIILFSDSGEAV